MKFLYNNLKENHQTVILENLKICEETFFAVAFLKNSGLDKIINEINDAIKDGKKISIIVGQNFALTEPTALLKLYNIFKKYRNTELYLAKANITNSIFHPKLYLFRKQNNCTIISGSANLTEGGLIKNKEVSILVNCKLTDDVWIGAKKHYNELISRENADLVSLLIIYQYQTFFETQKKHNKQSRPNPLRTNSQINFNYVNLLEHLQNLDDELLKQKFKIKFTNYKIAKKILDEIADNPNLTQKQFIILLDRLVGKKGQKRLWDSGSLFRLRKKVYPHFKQFQYLVKYIKENKNISSELVFENAKSIVKSIDGAAINYVTEIMMTYNTSTFANINKNPITVLKEQAGVNIKGHSSRYNGTDYKDYCLLIKEICVKLNLKNMLEADSLFNEIYWKL